VCCHWRVRQSNTRMFLFLLLMISSHFLSSFKIWKIRQKRVRAMLKGHTATISCLVFLPDSRSLISSSYDESLRIWCTRDGSLKRIINHRSLFFSVSLSQDGRYVTSANADKSLRIWDVRTGRLVMSWTGHSENIWSTVFVPNGVRMVLT
jgi:WD40 repeat protein